MRTKRLAGADDMFAQAERQIARGSNDKGEAVSTLPAADQQLLTLSGGRGPDIRADGKARQAVQGRGGRHPNRRAGTYRLAPAGIAAVYGALHRALLVAGSLQAVVTTDQPYDICAEFGRTGLAANFELDL